MTRFAKGERVKYRPQGCCQWVEALVIRAHRDKTCTIQSRFWLDSSDKPTGYWIGFKYRIENARLQLRGAQ